MRVARAWQAVNGGYWTAFEPEEVDRQLGRIYSLPITSLMEPGRNHGGEMGSIPSGRAEGEVGDAIRERWTSRALVLASLALLMVVALVVMAVVAAIDDFATWFRTSVGAIQIGFYSVLAVNVLLAVLGAVASVIALARDKARRVAITALAMAVAASLPALAILAFVCTEPSP